jgi:hypothetical protein
MHMIWAMSPDEFGAWGQWAGAVFTAVAVAVALWVAISDSKRRDREREDQRAAQARTIVSRVETITDVANRLNFVFSRQAVVIENHGSLPVTNVVIHSIVATHGGKRLQQWLIRARTSDEIHQDQSEYSLASVIGPGEHEASDGVAFMELMEQEEKKKQLSFDRFDVNSAEVDFSFLDAEGIRWRRVANGRPNRMLEG